MRCFPIRPHLLGLAVASGVVWAAAACVPGGAAAQEGGQANRPVAAEVGAGVTPPPDLVAAAQQLHAAARGRDAQAVSAMLSERVAVITSGITPAARRDVETKGPWPDADAALEAIGGAVLEGDVPPAAATAPTSRAAAQAFEVIAAATERPEWGRDPLLKGAFCTYRGLRWDARAGARIDDGSRGLHVPAATPVHASAAPAAPVIGTLKPGLIYLQGEMDDLPEGWRAVRLPSGRVGAVREADVRDPAAWGLCFRPKAGGGWLVSAFSAVLL
ncbi:hypothetical protein V5F59_09990 [Xanthobacter autotrophicus DSM 431]|uniref:hypothetical protein n=1 Tax=Xanthobacter nonsaccharivorans TaxID=3119912 RepID=UPI00372A2542